MRCLCRRHNCFTEQGNSSKGTRCKTRTSTVSAAHENPGLGFKSSFYDLHHDLHLDRESQCHGRFWLSATLCPADALPRCQPLTPALSTLRAVGPLPCRPSDAVSPLPRCQALVFCRLTLRAFSPLYRWPSALVALCLVDFSRCWPALLVVRVRCWRSALFALSFVGRPFDLLTCWCSALWPSALFAT